ncbi:uncharacterized protein LOC143298697 isoform X2 [Babylonia areolata]|uniref:uncharacterized protein LOC143298697 isoform X2 n=1 Tax=Babylonia areolata TaxID=304850 RepID=UPI003FD05B5D
MPVTGAGHALLPASQPMDAQAQAMGVASSAGAGPSGNWGGVTYLMPVVTVPYANTMGQVNLHWPPSQDVYGKDLPLSDVNTLRYFFNLGVEYFGVSSSMQHQQQQQQQQHQQQPQQQYSYLASSSQLTHAYQNGPAESCPFTQYGPTGPAAVSRPPAQPTSSYCTTYPPYRKPPPSLGIKPVQKLSISSTGSSSQEKEMKDPMEMASDVSDSGFTSSGEGEGEQGGEEDLDPSSSSSSVQRDPTKPSSSEDDPAAPQQDQGEEEDGEGGGGGARAVKEKGKRKYYMYGTHKLIKPIKDIPPRFLQLLSDMKVAKERCQGQPVYVLEPPEQQLTLDEDAAAATLNAEAQCFYPRHPFGVCLAGGAGYYVPTSTSAPPPASHPPPHVVPPPPTMTSFGGQVSAPPSALPSSGGYGQDSSLQYSLASSMPPPPPPPLPPVYVHGPCVGSVPVAGRIVPHMGGETPATKSAAPSSEADRGQAPRVPSPSHKTQHAPETPGPSVGVGPPHAAPATSAGLPSGPPPKANPASGGTCLSNGAGAEKPRVNYYLYHQSQTSTLTTLGAHGTGQAPAGPQGQVAYVVTPPAYGPPPSSVTYPPPVVGFPSYPTSIPCPPVAVQ